MLNVPEYSVYFLYDWKIWRDSAVDSPDPVALVSPCVL